MAKRGCAVFYSKNRRYPYFDMSVRMADVRSSPIFGWRAYTEAGRTLMSSRVDHGVAVVVHLLPYPRHIASCSDLAPVVFLGARKKTPNKLLI